MVKKKLIALALCASMLFSYGIDVSAQENNQIGQEKASDVDAALDGSEMDGSQDVTNTGDDNGFDDEADSDDENGPAEEETAMDSDESDIEENPVERADNESEEEFYGYRESEIEWGDEDDYDNNGHGLLQASPYPSSYDSRVYDCVTSVKNQNPWGSCWTFATLGAGESSMLKQGYASLSNEPNYSEYQLAYFFYNQKQDPLHNIDEDSCTIMNGQSFLEFGGNATLAAFALAGWVGAVDESETGYPSSSPLPELSNDLAISKDVAHLQNAYMISKVSNESGNQAKKLIMDYGAIASGFYFNTSYCYTAANGDVTYNYQGSGSANHAIMIVGWDDDYPKENFRASNAPSSNGAWLIKNSWGDSYPYIWVSYEDVRLNPHSAVACVFEPADNYDFNYQYDGTYGTSAIAFDGPVDIANVYTASGADEESIEAVGFALNTRRVNYSIQIYVNPTDATDPTSGVPMLAEPQTGTTDYLGYMTVKLDNPVKVNRGDKFAAVISLEGPNGVVKVFSDMDDLAFDDLLFIDSSAARGQSFYKENSDSFADCVDFDGATDLCMKIKVFTTAESSGQEVDTTVDLSNVTVSGIGDATYSGTAITPEPKLTYNGSTLKKNTDYTVSYSNNINVGTATVKITGKNNYKGTRSVTFKINALNVSSTSVTYTNSYKFTGSNICPVPTVKYNGKVLNAGTDYTISYADNKKIGTATMILTGKGNCTGSRKLNFSINGLSSYPTVYNGVDYRDVYDFNFYISNYPDIWAAFGWNSTAALTHFVNNGMSEGRQAKASFDVRSYKNAYGDLRSAFGKDLKQYYLHYINNGKKEGRKATGVLTQLGGTTVYNGKDYSAVYNYNYYLDHNPDVKTAFGGDEFDTIAHFVNCGMNEGRQGSENFNVRSYAYKYRDLRNVFKNNLRLYYLHYINNGKAEGRVATGTTTLQNPVTVYNGVNYGKVYDYNFYVGKYGDLKNAFGFDDAAVLEHFVNFGMNEARQAKSSFNVYNYKKRYKDLSGAFGNSWKLYYLHYINFGATEGRDGK